MIGGMKFLHPVLAAMQPKRSAVPASLMRHPFPWSVLEVGKSFVYPRSAEIVEHAVAEWNRKLAPKRFQSVSLDADHTRIVRVA